MSNEEENHVHISREIVYEEVERYCIGCAKITKHIHQIFENLHQTIYCDECMVQEI